MYLMKISIVYLLVCCVVFILGLLFILGLFFWSSFLFRSRLSITIIEA